MLRIPQYSEKSRQKKEKLALLQDIIDLIFHVTLQDHMIKVLIEFMEGSYPRCQAW